MIATSLTRNAARSPARKGAYAEHTSAPSDEELDGTPQLDDYVKGLDGGGGPMLPQLGGPARRAAGPASLADTTVPQLAGPRPPQAAPAAAPSLADTMTPQIGPHTSDAMDRWQARRINARANTGSTPEFYQTLQRDRARAANKRDVFARNLANGMSDAQARRAAYVSDQNAVADQNSGNFYTNRDLTLDANRRANEQSAANANRTNAEALMIPDLGALYRGQGADAQPRAQARTALQGPMADLARARATAAGTEAEYAGPRAEAGINRVQAEANAKNAYG